MYKKMYYHLFNKITDAIEFSSETVVKEILKQAQIETEEMYINATEEQ